ncbi:glycosyltransferase family 4 protein [Microbacterium sp. LWH3-1.2]|uniref:glycosyltransferase family 4 protein n=1 Tax=Microbacterium sp. LWH3-1.2 TaxID=3135256 RepID=UPI0034361940
MSDGRLVFLSLAPGVWGAERSMLTLAQSLLGLGEELLLICTDEGLANEWQRITHAPVEVVAIPGGSRRAVVRRFFGQVTPRTSRTDTLVIFSYVLAAGTLGRFSWPHGRPRVVIDLHDTLTRHKGRLALSLASIRAHRVVAVSKFTAQQLHRPLRNKVRVLTRPVSPISFDPPDLQSASIRVGVIGRIHPQKNAALLIRAAEELPDVRVVVRGDVAADDSDYARSLQELGSSRLGTRFVIESARPWRYALDDLDVLLVANSSEPMGRTVLEAQLRGVTVVVPDSGGSTELVADGVTGFVYHADDAQSLARVLGRLRETDVMGMREAARMEAKRATDPVAYATNYLGVIR